ncbi:tetrameric acyl-CoA thioesterase [bacterium CG_4_9_14_3_um_filter_65_15]|nr:MAG: tetrameric acyl-CoA thioesterase [bacterium CG_4_9_14_3_um_filter_65_15]
MKMTPGRLRFLLNIYPPYLGAGIRVEAISADWRRSRVSLTRRWYNRNAVGTHFGGSLYAMIDPHLMLMMMRLLGPEYVVWDKGAEIEFVKATRRQVTSVLEISAADLDAVRRHTADGEKFLPQFPVEIRDEDGETVARVVKTLYVRRKIPRPAP